MPKTYLALVRHGVTDWNYEGRAQGHTNIPLNAEGRRQAEAVAVRLATEPWDHIYSSPLLRARATAQAICRRTGHEPILEARLVERDMGVAEGTIEPERQLRWPGATWNSLPGLETNEHLAQRGLEVFTEIARRHEGQRVICISHGAMINAFLRAIVPPSATPPSLTAQRNTAITGVWYDGLQFEQVGSPEFRHLLIDGVEYTGEKGRLAFEANRVGLPGVHLPPAEAEAFIHNATAVESAWADNLLVGYARAFTDRVLYGYIDVIYTLPGYEHVRSVLISRLEQRNPGIAFRILPTLLEERSGA